jgi:hypothetical protein
LLQTENREEGGQEQWEGWRGPTGGRAVGAIIGVTSFDDRVLLSSSTIEELPLKIVPVIQPTITPNTPLSNTASPTTCTDNKTGMILRRWCAYLMANWGTAMLTWRIFIARYVGPFQTLRQGWERGGRGEMGKTHRIQVPPRLTHD